MEFALDEKDRRFTSHSPTSDDAEPELKKQRLGGDSDGSGGDSNSDGRGGGSNSYGSGGDSNSYGSGGDSNSDESRVSCGVSNVFIGNEHDDVYFEEYKYMLEPEDYENSTLEEKRQYGRYFHQIRISNCYYLDFIPTFPLWTGPRPIDFTDEDHRKCFLGRILKCIKVALGKQEENLELVTIVRANYSIGYGSVYWITMDVRNNDTGEIKTCICKVHFGVKGGAEDDMIVEHFMFIPSIIKNLQGMNQGTEDQPGGQ